MAPMVIADSDDEDELNCSQPPRSPEGSSFGASNIPGHASYSESTDPAFFQDVLNEQSAAARGKSYETCLENMEPTGKPGGRVREQQDSAEASSVTSTDPLQAGTELEGNGNITRLRVMGSKAGAIEADGRRGLADDPWEIPSSPDEARAMRVQRSKKRDGKRGKTSEATSGASGNTTTNRSFQSSPFGVDEMETRRSKRRKVVTEPTVDHDAEEVDLVQKPPTQQSDGDVRQLSPETMPPPTLPIDRSSFIVALKTRRRDAGQESGDEPSQDQGLSKPEAGVGLAQSSGSATNTNTPRSEPRSSRRSKGESRQSNTKNQTNNDNDHETELWTSSLNDMGNNDPTVSVGRRGNRNPGPPQEIAIPQAEEADQSDSPPLYEEQLPGSGDEESDFAEPVPKAKKQRGRPKKAEDQKTTSKTKNAAEDHQTNDKSTAKSKKKRGRPKKSDQPAVESKPPEDNFSIDAKEPSPIKAEDVAKEERSTSNVPEEGEIPVKDVKPEADQSRAPGIADVHMRLETETGENTVKHVKQEEEGKKTPYKPTKLGVTNSDGSKPVYRVGLSKKSRIAPLLKIVRK